MEEEKEVTASEPVVEVGETTGTEEAKEESAPEGVATA